MKPTTQATRRAALLRQMIRLRGFEERCAQPQPGGEAAAAGVLESLGGEDALVSTHQEYRHGSSSRQRPLVTVCLYGDGAIDSEDLYDAFTDAVESHLPVLFCCEHNLSGPPHHDLSLPATFYDLPSTAVDGMDVLAVADAVGEAVKAIRDGAGPRLLELFTYRAGDLSFDPIPVLIERMTTEDEFTTADLTEIREAVAAELATAG
ncbi:MAG TPA: thiamine pyrophosphate-dependent enzyme [Amycolatopsis sp.]|nr:thiamine pyrophosphate-dependent enzyme [Amycolatopsis sp.]